MTIVTIPTMYLNFLGSQVTVDLRDPLGLSLLTLGNNGVPNATACHGDRGNATAPCVEDVVDLFGYTIKLSTSSYIIAFSDVLSSAIFLAFIIIFKLRLTRLVRLVDHNHVTASDYSVYCRGFPENATAQEIREHFSGLYQLKVLDWEYDGWCLKCVACRTADGIVGGRWAVVGQGGGCCGCPSQLSPPPLPLTAVGS